MGKKKNKQADKSFVEVIGLKRILQNDIINFTIGIILILFSIYTIIAFISFFSTGQYDQSIILDHSPQEIFNKNREFKNSCGSFGAFLSYFFISKCFGPSEVAVMNGKLILVVVAVDNSFFAFSAASFNL